MVAEHTGTEHHEIMVDEGMVLGAIEKVAYHHDEPVGDAAILNNYFLSREACKWVKVVLAGEGGDELFAGYDNYSRCLQMRRLRSRRAVGELAHRVALLFPGRGDLRRGMMEKELSMLEEGDLDRRLSISTRELSPRELKWLTGTPGPDLEGMGWPPQGISGDLDRLLYNDLRNRMAEGYLMKADKANMANSVEERLPLLDKSLAELAFSLPAELKLKGRTEKHILRLALHGRLPDTILARKKMGFSTPVSDWMRGEVGEAAVERITANALVRSITDPANLGKWVAQAEKKRLHRPRAFWNLYALAVWHDTFF
jgi:asparagine synthase (glutamine-hydrolysing)